VLKDLQPAEIPQALEKLDTAEGIEKIDLLNSLSVYYLEKNPPAALKYSQESLKLSETAMDAKYLAESHYLVGRSHYFLLDFLSAIESFTNAAVLFSTIDDLINESKALNLIGICQFTLGDNARALDTNYKALELSQKTGDKREESEALMQIGLTHLSNREQALSIDYLNKAYNIRLTSGTKKDLAGVIGNMGNAYVYLQEYQKAYDNYQRCYHIFAELGNEIGIARAYLNSGIALGALHRFDEALSSVDTALEMFTKLKKQEPICSCLSTTGSIYAEMDDHKSAVEYFQKALDYGEAYKFRHLLENIYGALSDSYEKLNEYDESLKYFKKSHEIITQRLQEASEMKTRYLDVAHRVDTFKKESEELAAKNTELKKLNTQLTQLNIEKNEFLGIASHDLKNPLASISLSATTLKKHYKNFAPEKVENYLDKIAATSDRMKNIIINLLNINTIESGEYNITKSEINLSKLIEYIIDDFEQNAKQKNIEIKFVQPKEIKITTDEQAIHRILENLISNAIKYSNPDGTVDIELLSGSDKVTIKIKDNGLGIQDSEKKRVFQKFPRLSNKPTAGENSTGLGLSIVKKLTELIGGNISFESEYGKGTTFVLELPL